MSTLGTLHNRLYSASPWDQRVLLTSNISGHFIDARECLWDILGLAIAVHSSTNQAALDHTELRLDEGAGASQSSISSRQFHPQRVLYREELTSNLCMYYRVANSGLWLSVF